MQPAARDGWEGAASPPGRRATPAGTVRAATSPGPRAATATRLRRAVVTAAPARNGSDGTAPASDAGRDGSGVRRDGSGDSGVPPADGWDRGQRRSGMPRTIAGLVMLAVAVAAGVGRMTAEPAAPERRLTVSVDADRQEPAPGGLPGADTGSLPGADAGARSAASLGGWTPTEAGPLNPRAGAASIRAGDEVFVWGGQRAPMGAGAPWLDDGATLDPATGRWRALPRAPLRGRAGAAAAWTGSEVLVWGGVAGDAGGHLRPLADGAAYDPVRRRWRRLPRAPLSPRLGAAVATIGGRVVVFGGFDPRTSRRLHDGAVYDVGGDRWTAMSPPPAAAADDVSPRMTALGSEAFVWFPSLDRDRQAAARYDPRSDRWSRVSAPPVDGGLVPGMADTGNGLLVAGRVFGPGEGSTLLRYDPEPDRWVRLASPPVVWTTATRVTWTGRHLLVWPGGAGGAAYDPATGRWTPLPAAPLGLRAPAWQVWTGSHLLAWSAAAPPGGSSPAAAWSPVSPWQASTAPLLPSSGGSLSLAGDGRVLLWGGSYGPPHAPAADGLLLSPTTDDWAAVPPSPLSGRRGHAAVPVDGQVLVLGGYGGSGGADRAAGAARYRPGTGWARAAEPPLHVTAGAAAAVGDRVVAVGAATPTVAVRGAAGGRVPALAAAEYHPRTDRWRALPDPPLPAGGNVRALSVGGELVVWASVDGGGGGGARLDLRRRRWARLPAPPHAVRGAALAATAGGLVMVAGDGRTAFLAANASRWRLLETLAEDGERPPVLLDTASGVLAYRPEGPAAARLDTASGRWSVLPAPPLPAASEAIAVDTAAGVLVVAGGHAAMLR